jgi:hypothetical protein
MILKRLFSGGAAAERGWPEVRRWAQAQGDRFAVGRGGEGFVVETAGDAGGSCRIEWGPSQRAYIAGHELRIRAELGGRQDLQMLCATRELIRRLEQEAFRQFTEGTETRIDEDTPEEMRWVVMYPPVPGHLLGELSQRFGVLASRPQAATLWLEEGLQAALADGSAWLEPGAPAALIVQRARFVLRAACGKPTVPALGGAKALALAAAAAARRVAAQVRRGGVSSQRPSSWGPAPAAPGKTKDGSEHR